MFNELPLVDTQIQPFPVLWFLQESTVSAVRSAEPAICLHPRLLTAFL